ncbi:hypothetical protein [Streptomyces niveus]|uniref:hypothetical protein n=1 Tax=Streptomyces niveus TaxID=193462 RepID=UPI003662E203
MGRTVACTAAPVSRGLLALLVGVVTLLCVLGPARAGAVESPPVAGGPTYAVNASAGLVDQPGGSAAPCGKKAVLETGPQRADSGPRVSPLPASHVTDTGLTRPFAEEGRCRPSGPAPPAPILPLHSVLRI